MLQFIKFCFYVLLLHISDACPQTVYICLVALVCKSLSRVECLLGWFLVLTNFTRFLLGRGCFEKFISCSTSLWTSGDVILVEIIHTINLWSFQFTHLLSAAQWLLMACKSCENVTTDVRMFSPSQKKSLSPHLPFSVPPSHISPSPVAKKY